MMFKLTDEEIVVYPMMTLMHPDDYSKIDRATFDLFYKVYVEEDTGLQIYPEPSELTYPTVDPATGFISEYVAKEQSHRPWEEHPNWETRRPPTGLSMNSLMAMGRLLGYTPRYKKRLSEETLWKTSRTQDRTKLASGLSLPGINTETIGLFICNNQTCSGSVYRNEDDTKILFYARPSDFEDGLPNEFDDAYVESRLEVTLDYVLIPPGSYVLGPTMSAPLADEPPLALTLTKTYIARTVVNMAGWLQGIYLIKNEGITDEHI